VKKNPHAVALGRLGGKAGTPAQRKAHAEAARETGKKNRKYSPCQKAPKDRKQRHAFDNETDRCWFCKKTRSEAALKQ